MTSQGPSTLCECPETENECKSEAVTALLVNILIEYVFKGAISTMLQLDLVKTV